MIRLLTPSSAKRRHGQSSARRSTRTGALSWCLGGLLLAAGATAATQDANTTYVTAQADAQVRSFHDPKGALVHRLDAGTLLQVHSTSTGAYPYYEVEVAGGMPVWVHGSLLAQTATSNVLRVTGSNVLMRPMPEASRKAMPLPTKLQIGTRVEMLGRHDPAKAMADDWIQVRTPEGARGWVLVSQTTPHADATAAASAWKASRVALPEAPANAPAEAAPRPLNSGRAASTTSSNGAAQNASNARPTAAKVPQGAIDALAEADRLYDAVKGKAGVSAMEVEPAVTAYERALTLAPAGSTVSKVAERRLAQAELLHQIAMLNDRQARVDQQTQARLEEIQAAEVARNAKHHTSWGRFNGRGWLEKEEAPGKPTRWFLRWSGDRAVEVVSRSGRYDLANFEGYQIGVQGTTRREATPVSLDADAQLRLLDIYRIEVISGGRESR